MSFGWNQQLLKDQLLNQSIYYNLLDIKLFVYFICEFVFSAVCVLFLKLIAHLVVLLLYFLSLFSIKKNKKRIKRVGLGCREG
jgi:hypothetical protein